MYNTQTEVQEVNKKWGLTSLLITVDDSMITQRASTARNGFFDLTLVYHSKKFWVEFRVFEEHFVKLFSFQRARRLSFRRSKSSNSMSGAKRYSTANPHSRQGFNEKFLKNFSSKHFLNQRPGINKENSGKQLQ